MAKRKSKVIKFNETDITAMQHDAARMGALDFTKAQVQKILAANPNGCAEAIWDDFESVGHPDASGMDTAVRDIWFDAIAHYYTGTSWPLNMDGEEYSNKFYTKLKTALKKDKVKIIK